MDGVLEAATAMGLSSLLVMMLRRYAVRRAILDHPTVRSSHTAPTPRGGGLGLVAATIVLWMVAGWPPTLGPTLAVLGAALVAVAGWRDDHGGLAVPVRLGAHMVAAICLLPLASLPSLEPVWLAWLGPVWWVIWAVSSINVVNFMDGIDGLIGGQAVLFGISCWWLGIEDGQAAAFGAALVGAALGFLVWNWAPAKIFLGDVGSGTVGYLFVVGGVLVLGERRVSLVTVFMPLFPIFLDAAVTLLGRVRRGERLTEPHRRHLYQRLANNGLGHRRVALLYAIGAGLGVVAAVVEAGQGRGLVTVSYFVLIAAGGILLHRWERRRDQTR